MVVVSVQFDHALAFHQCAWCCVSIVQTPTEGPNKLLELAEAMIKRLPDVTAQKPLAVECMFCARILSFGA